MPDSRSKILSLESLRGVLALWVLVAHVTGRAISEGTIAAAHARALLEPLLPVYVFMILSGFVIFGLLVREQESYRVFILRRFFRLAPLFLVVLLIAAQLVSFELRTLDHLFWRNPDIYDAIKVHKNTLAHYWPHFWSHLLLVHGLVPDTVLPDGNFAFLSQGWSVSLEWQFYLLAPLIFYLISGKRYFGLALLTAAILWLYTLNVPSVGFLPNQFVYFMLGIASFYAFRSSAWFARIAPHARDSLLVVICCALYFLLPQPLPIIIWLVVLNAIMAHRAGLETWFSAALNRALEQPALQWLGRISYSLYLVHIPIVYVVFRAITRLDEHLGGWKVLSLALPATIMLSLLVAAVTHRLVEIPGMALGKVLSAHVARKTGHRPV